MVDALVNLFFPKVCYACLNLLHDNEDAICVNCRNDLPVTNFHYDNNDAIKKVLYGRAKVAFATALFRFEKKSLVQQLIHGLKYKGYEHIGFVLGNWLGGELKDIKAYRNIDLVIPVPLHIKRLKKRGYNQVTKFGEQIAKTLDAEFIDDILVKVSSRESQINKTRFMRWTDNNELFTVKNTDKLSGKNILLVDDIITTGATLEACIHVLKQAKNIKICVATIAIA